MLIDHAFPAKKIENTELQRGAWSAQKIFEKIGIRSRFTATEHETALDLGFQAAENLIHKHKINRDHIDCLLYCTQSPDYIIPNNVSLLHERLHLKTKIPAIEYNQGCTGYIYGLFLAKSLILSQQVNTVLFVTADTYTKYLKEDNLGCRTVFGDGATASLISKADSQQFGECVFGTNGTDFQSLYLSGVGAKTKNEPLDLHMDGPAVFSFTLKVVPTVIAETLEKNKLTLDDIDHVVFHQANGFMLEALREKIGIPLEKFCLHFSESGNTVSSTIPIVLQNLFETKKLKPNAKILLCGFGVGLSWGAVIIQVLTEAQAEA